MEKPLDLRVQKTRKSLCEALYKLLSQKSLNRITVTELCEKAMIRKATFYKHFSDKYELLGYLMRQLESQARKEYQIEYNSKKPQDYFIGWFRYFMDFIEAHEAFVSKVLKSDAGPVVESVLSIQIRTDISHHLRHTPPENLPTDPEMAAVLYAGAITACGKWWILQKERMSKERIVEQFSALINRLYRKTRLD